MKERKLSVLEYAIIGLVLEAPMTGYAIRKTFENTALGNYSSSPGSIYPAIKRLNDRGLLVAQSSAKSNATAISVSEAGRVAIREWVQLPLDRDMIAKHLDEVLLRFAFMGTLVSNDKTLVFLHQLQHQLKSYLAELNDFVASDYSSMPLHGQLAFDHGITSAKATLRWSSGAIRRIKNANS